MNSVENGGGVGALGLGSVEIMRGVEGCAKLREGGGQPVRPEGRVAAGSVEEDDGGMGLGGDGFGLVDADGRAAAEEGALHGVWML